MKLPRTATEAASIATKLREWYLAANTRGHKAVVPPQIVNPVLCQQLIDRLGPSLERHKGCVLIDIRPGVCLWSQYLHEFLKPRRHILMEDPVTFGKHINPLLSRPDTRYQLSENYSLRSVFDNLSKDFGDSLPESERYVTENPQILLNASFYTESVHIKSHLLTTGASDLLNSLHASFYGLRSDLFRYGLFRSLIWMPDEHKYQVLPRTVDRQSRQSIQFAVSSKITEVAGSQVSTELNMYRTRHYGILVEDMEAVRRKEKDAGIVTPEERIHKHPIPPFEYLHPSMNTWQREEFIDPPYFWRDLQELDSVVARTNPSVYKLFASRWDDQSRKRIPRMKQKINDDLNVKQWRLLYTRARRRHSALLAKLRDVNEQRSIDQAWRAAEATDDSAALAELITRELTSRKRLQNQPGNDAVWVRKAIDDYRAYDTAALAWHRRAYNPLAVSETDFATGRATKTDKQLALLDIEPKPEFRKTFDTHAATRCLELVLVRLTTAMAFNVPTSLKQIVPGGVDDFVASVPSLRDTTKGGWIDLNELRVRTMPPELWRDIALAYYNWPFRLDEQELWHALTLRDQLRFNSF